MADRGGAGNPNTAISGNSATTTRARGPRKQENHEQETPQEPLTAVQGQGGVGRHQGREDAGRAGQGARCARQPDRGLEEPVARTRVQRVRRGVGIGANGRSEGAARQDRAARLGE